MKAPVLFLFFFIICKKSFCQNSPSDFLNNKCTYETDGTGKSMGLKIKLAHSCMWTKSNGDRPHVVQKFFYSFGDGSSLNESLTISKIAESFTKKEKALLFTEDGLREMVKDLGTFVSARKVKIDGMDCGEVTVRIKRESPAVTIYMYLIQYYLIYKDKMINISFGTGGMEESQVKNLFNKYKLLFQTFATNTVLISKWE